MSWVYYNPNPLGNLVGDCTIRALTLALNKDWDKTYLAVSTQGYEMNDPNQILQYLLNTNQVSQDQVNKAMRMRNDPQMQQYFR